MPWIRCCRTATWLAAFLRQLDWIGRYQMDWPHGSWYGQLSPQLRPSGAKAGGDYRSPYHTGRAMVDCLDLADAILAGAPTGGRTLV